MFGKKFMPMRLHVPTGQYYVWMPELKKRIYLGKDESKAKVHYQELKQQYQLIDIPPVETQTSIEPTPTPSTTINDLILQYLPHLEAKKLDPRRWVKIRIAMQYLSKHYGSKDAAEFRAKAFKKLREIIVQQRNSRTGEPISRTYINAICWEVQQFAQWAGEEELITAESAMSIRMVKKLKIGEAGKETDIRTPPPPGSVEATLEYLWQPVASMVRLQMLTGMRPSEVCEFRLKNLSRSPEEKIQLPRTRSFVSAFQHNGILLWVYVPENHKTLSKGKPRVVPIGPKGQQILLPLLRNCPPLAHVFNPRKGNNPKMRKIQKNLEYYTVVSYCQAIAKAIIRGNHERMREDPPRSIIPHWYPYQIRHMVGTMAGDGYSADTAAAVLGHSGLDTINTYMQQQLGKAASFAAEQG